MARSTRTPEMLPLALVPEIFPVALTPEILPLALTPEILPSALEVLPEMLPLALTPEMFPARVDEESADISSNAQRSDLALFMIILLVIPKRLLGKRALNWGIDHLEVSFPSS